MPDDVIVGRVDEDDVAQCADGPRRRPRTQAEPDADVAAAHRGAAGSAERPLVIVGKGMAWSRAEDEVRAVHRARPSCRSSPRRWARA